MFGITTPVNNDNTMPDLIPVVEETTNTESKPVQENVLDQETPDPVTTDPEPVTSEKPTNVETKAESKNDDYDEIPDIGENEEIPDIDLKEVSKLSEVLGDMKYEDVRKGLYKKYGLVVKDETSISNLYMITYNKPDRQSSKHKVTLTEEQKKIVDQYRGVIVEKNTNKPLCYTFDKMTRHFPEEWDLKDCKITKACDGSQIKLFYSQTGKYWVVSTTRRIDASRSYFFSNKSFMEMFQDASNTLNWDRMDKNCCYSLVLAHPDNRVVARHNKPFLTHVLTRNMETFQTVSQDIGLPRPQEVSFNSKSDIWKSIKRMPFYMEGYVVQRGNTFIKLVNSKYQEVKELRGSSSSLLFHYFHLKKNKKIKQFLSYYPESSETFKYFDGCFQNLCMLAYNEYILLRVRKVIEPPQVLKFLKPVLYRVHGLHLTNKIRIRLADVKAHLEDYPPYMLRKLVDMANGLPYSFI